MSSLQEKTWGICFREGENTPGYILVRPLFHGGQGQVYLVQCLQTGSYYVRKHIHAKPPNSPNSDISPSQKSKSQSPEKGKTVRRSANMLTTDTKPLLGREKEGSFHTPSIHSTEDRSPTSRSEELDLRTREPSFHSIVPSSIAPSLIHHTRYENEGDAIIYEFCNGGDLYYFLDLCWEGTDREGIELLMWKLLDLLVRALAFMKTGWTLETDKVVEGWDPICHGDIFCRNIFVHWEEDSKSPVLKLGDWGLASKKSDNSDQWSWSIACQEDRDNMKGLYEFIVDQLQDEAWDATGIFECWELLIEELDKEDQCTMVALAKGLIPLIKEKIEELESQTEKTDLTWTRLIAEDNLKVWEKSNGRPEGLREPWVWIDLSKVPKFVLRDEIVIDSPLS